LTGIFFTTILVAIGTRHLNIWESRPHLRRKRMKKAPAKKKATKKKK
jgi:hypothetical protein